MADYFHNTYLPNPICSAEAARGLGRRGHFLGRAAYHLIVDVF